MGRFFRKLQQEHLRKTPPFEESKGGADHMTEDPKHQRCAARVSYEFSISYSRWSGPEWGPEPEQPQRAVCAERTCEPPSSRWPWRQAS